MGKSALIPGKPTLLATAHHHGQVRIYELTEKYVRQKAELRTQEQFDEELHINYRMEILRMAFSNDRDLAVLCRPKLPNTEPTPFADQGESGPSKGHVLKLVSTSLLVFDSTFSKSCLRRRKAKIYCCVDILRPRDIPT